MQNIDPVYFLTPIAVIGFSVGLVIYWHFKKSLTKWTLMYSLAAYAGAIALKYAVQIPTIKWFTASVGGNLFALGFYYGLQTAIFEVGGAFLVASYAVKKGHFQSKDAGGYGVGLALWENGILVGALLLINYIAYYAILSSGSGLAQLVYSSLSTNAPSLFYEPSRALPLIGYAILERVSSLLAHFSWGSLCALAAVSKKKVYFVIALPIGFAIDFLAPFARNLGVGLFELIIFIISIVSLIVAVSDTRKIRVQPGSINSQSPDAA